MKSTIPAVVVSVAALVVAVVALAVRPAATAPREGNEAGVQKLEGKLDAMASSQRETDARLARVHAELTALAESVDRLAQAAEKTRATAARRRRPAQIEPGVKFRDTFEEGTSGWFVARFTPMIIGKVSRTTEEGKAREGRGALSFSFDLKPNTLPLTVRNCPPVNRLSFWIRATHSQANVYVGAHERDDSDYGTIFSVEPGEGWKHVAVDMSTFVLGDDSQDENDRLDFDQITNVAIADVSAFMGGSGPNVLLIDEVVGEFRKPEARDGDGDGNARF